MQNSPHGSHLVTVDWLAAHRAEVVLLDATVDRETDVSGQTSFIEGRALFEKAHIPGARFVDLISAFSDPAGRFPFTCPHADHLQASARNLGISQSSTVVVYDSLTGAWAARVWWVLRAFGFDRVFVLNGGLRLWRDTGRQTAAGAEEKSWAKGDFIARPRDGFFVDLPVVKAISASQPADTALVCGTRRPEYIGKDAGGIGPGHIPGSINLPYPDFLTSNGLFDISAARSTIMAGDFSSLDRIVFYCGGGINAAGLGLVFAEAGFDRTTIYDGSLNEWRSDPNLPLIGGV